MNALAKCDATQHGVQLSTERRVLPELLLSFHFSCAPYSWIGLMLHQFPCAWLLCCRVCVCLSCVGFSKYPCLQDAPDLFGFLIQPSAPVNCNRNSACAGEEAAITTLHICWWTEAADLTQTSNDSNISINRLVYTGCALWCFMSSKVVVPAAPADTPPKMQQESIALRYEGDIAHLSSF